MMPSTARDYGLNVPDELVELDKQRANTKKGTPERKAADKALQAKSEEYKNRPDLDERFDPSKATAARDTMMDKLLKMYNGNQALAVAAYNAGPGTVNNYLKGGTLPEETLGYLAKIWGN
jgi:hypothetical protein